MDAIYCSSSKLLLLNTNAKDERMQLHRRAAAARSIVLSVILNVPAGTNDYR
jgi:hypothetical protein